MKFVIAVLVLLLAAVAYSRPIDLGNRIFVDAHRTLMSAEGKISSCDCFFDWVEFSKGCQVKEEQNNCEEGFYCQCNAVYSLKVCEGQCALNATLSE